MAFLRAAGALAGILLVGCATARGPAEVGLPAGVSADQLPVRGGYTGRFNNDDQSHADFCVRLTKPRVSLRYADGTPSGFDLTPELLQPQPGNGVWCPEAGMARLDAREFVSAADGSRMLFHRGGWGFKGNDPGSAVHYGHVLASDIEPTGLKYVRTDAVERLPGTPSGRWVPAPTEPWVGKGQEAGNGTACEARSAVPYTVSVQSIPDDMRYLNSAQTNAIRYTIYGDPSEDLGPAADRARGIRYTLLQWSWINVRGGGVARALVKDGEAFYPCTDVPPIQLSSVSDVQTRMRTGWVQAIYGAIRAGEGEWLYGWIVSAHQHRGETVVTHMVR
jgi:hypothetical protein